MRTKKPSTELLKARARSNNKKWFADYTLIYFIRFDKDHSVIKVGSTCDLLRRASALMNQHKSNATVLAVYETSPNNEYYWFRKYRVSEKYYLRNHGKELLEVTDELLSEMNGVNDKNIYSREKQIQIDTKLKSDDYYRTRPNLAKSRKVSKYKLKFI